MDNMEDLQQITDKKGCRRHLESGGKENLGRTMDARTWGVFKHGGQRTSGILEETWKVEEKDNTQEMKDMVDSEDMKIIAEIEDMEGIWDIK